MRGISKAPMTLKLKHISAVAARVAGTVTGVYIEENQYVKAGQVLVDLDPRDFKTAYAQARSELT